MLTSGDRISSSSTDLGGLSATLEHGQSLLFGKFQVDIVRGEDDRHYTMKLNGSDIGPGVFGGLILRSFLILDESGDGVKGAMESLDLGGLNYKKFKAFSDMLKEYLMDSSYFNLSGDVTFGSVDRTVVRLMPLLGNNNNKEIVTLKGVKTAGSCHIANILFDLVKRGKYTRAAFLSSGLLYFYTWKSRYAGTKFSDKATGDG